MLCDEPFDCNLYSDVLHFSACQWASSNWFGALETAASWVAEVVLQKESSAAQKPSTAKKFLKTEQPSRQASTPLQTGLMKKEVQHCIEEEVRCWEELQQKEVKQEKFQQEKIKCQKKLQQKKVKHLKAKCEAVEALQLAVNRHHNKEAHCQKQVRQKKAFHKKLHCQYEAHEEAHHQKQRRLNEEAACCQEETRLFNKATHCLEQQSDAAEEEDEKFYIYVIKFIIKECYKNKNHCLYSVYFRNFNDFNNVLNINW